MDKSKWKKRITKQIKIEHDYIASFQTTIDILAEILEERDRVYKAYIEDGAQPTIIFTTDRGQKNPKPNPLLTQWQDLNVTALQYLRDLGLSPAGLRKLQGQLPKDRGNRPGGILEQIRNEYSLDKFKGAYNGKE